MIIKKLRKCFHPLKNFWLKTVSIFFFSSEDRILYFKDGRILVPQYGSSRQISLALGGDRAIKLLFHQPNIQVFFEDGKPLPENLRGNKNVIEIDSSELFYR